MGAIIMTSIEHVEKVDLTGIELGPSLTIRPRHYPRLQGLIGDVAAFAAVVVIFFFVGPLAI